MLWEKLETKYGYGIVLLYLFIFTVLAGSITINLVPDNVIKGLDIWGTDCVEKYMTKKYEYVVMVKYVGEQRLREYLFLCIAFFTKLFKLFIYLLTAFVGTVWGVTASIIIMEYGINGLRLCFFLLFPHMYIYTIVVAAMTYKYIRIFGRQKTKVDYITILLLIVLLLIIICGILLESFVNVKLLKVVMTDIK